MTEARHFILATAGHVDHGKSALVEALTKTHPDRLPEERKRGMTIELGFAELPLSSPLPHWTPMHVGVIDVPGHEDFVKNMIAGMGCVNLGLIVVAADDGWMPQTEEHFQILEYLGVQRLVIALNKIDLAEDDEDFLREVVQEEILGTAYENAPIVATSAANGRGVSELKQTLASILDSLPTPPDIEKPRLSVDRAFSVKGHGTVVTGSLADGCFHVEQSVVVQPQGISARIRSMQCFGRVAESAGPGTRVAINLANVALRSTSVSTTEGVGRGDVVTAKNFEKPGRVLDAVITKSKRLVGGKTPASKPLKHGARVRLHHGSANIPGRIFFLNCLELKPGQEAIGELRLERTASVLTGDRFVIRDWAETHTLAGGIALDVRASAGRFRSERQRTYLEACRRSPSAALPTMMRAQIVREQTLPEAELMRGSRFGSQEIRECAAMLETEGTILRRRGIVFEANYWKAQLGAATNAINHFHQTHPELLGLPLSQLRNCLDKRLKSQGAFNAILDALTESDFIVQSAAIQRSGFTISLPPNLQDAANQIRKALGEKADEPPARKQIIASKEEEQAMRFLIDSGEAVELNKDLALLQTGYDKLFESIKKFLKTHRAASVSQLRQYTGVSRRVMIPFLQLLDAQGITIREGGLRRLPKQSNKPTAGKNKIPPPKSSKTKGKKIGKKDCQTVNRSPLNHADMTNPNNEST